MTTLDPYEDKVLRSMEDHVTAEDPRLSRRIGGMRETLLVRASPVRWSPSLYLTIGAMLLGIGILLSDARTIFGALLAFFLGCCRVVVVAREANRREQHVKRRRPFRSQP
jgi:hypothetical protein